MLSKESKIRVLENYYGIDIAIFGKLIKNVDNCCPIVKEEYVQIKGALLSVFIEMLKLMEHSPAPIQEKVESKQLLKMAKNSAKNARCASKKIVTTEAAKKDIYAELKETLTENKKADVHKIVETKIREKAFRLAIDNMLVARSLNESKNIKALNEWPGRIIEDSYKILRDNLVETAMLILYDES